MSDSPSLERLGRGAETAAYLGMAPFVACPLGVALLPTYELRLIAQEVALAWGAVVLASVGAVHWGLALGGRFVLTPLRIGAVAFAGLCAVGSLLLGGQRGLALLVVGFGMFWLYEHRGVGEELPEDYLRLRRNLTVAGCSLLAITMFISGSAGLV